MDNTIWRSRLNNTGMILLTGLLSACVSDNPQSGAGNDMPGAGDRIAELQVVDCLLPGQTRMLGSQVYITARRPAMLTASECRIRGGEYVAYDRADLKTALTVWLPAAEAGDADAQANVGEIFERGLGGEPNYEAAALWYQKAAEQNNQRALFNLGTLYEQGLGVAQDKLMAMNYYRRAWGLPEDSLVYQSSVAEQQAAMEEQLRKQIARKDSQIRLLQNQVAGLRVELQQQSDNSELLAQMDDLNALVTSLKAENQSSKSRLAELEEQGNTRKIRTVVAKDQPTFTAASADIISADINFGKYYALVIGVQDYDNVESLDTPINDINAVADVLANNYGFTVTKVINADNISIMEAINNLGQQLTENDNLLIFYAGHGVRLANEQLESGYWLPSNADAPPRDTNWVANEFITRHLARLKAKRVLIVADSCYAGLLSTAPDFMLLGQQQNNPEFLRYKAGKRSRLLLTSGGDRPVLDSNGEKHSIFASAFIDTLKNNQHILTGPELFRAVHGRVVRESATADFQQEPQYRAIKGAGHEVGDFFFVPQAKKG
ncbi:MAG TPA: caspase family protein [Pseudomonadales bacterium]